MSVVIPCFNQARYLKPCIASLQAQTWRHWEALIVNDGSPDETLLVAHSLAGQEPRVRVIDRRNGGPSAARNTGIAAAKGQWLQFLDADDLILPSKFAAQLTLGMREPDVDLIFGSAWYFPDMEPGRRRRSLSATGVAHDWIARNAANPADAEIKFAYENQFPICSPLVRRSLFKRFGDFRNDLIASEDWELWMRFAAGGAVMRYLDAPDTEALIRLHVTSASQNIDHMLRGELQMRLFSLDYLVRDEARLRTLQRIVASLRGLKWAIAKCTCGALRHGA